MVTYSDYEYDNRVRRYAEALARNGYDVDAIGLRRHNQPHDVETINGVRIFRVQNRTTNEKQKVTYLLKMLFFLIRSMIVLTREHTKKPYDLIHVHSVPDFEVFAAVYPKLTGAKIILDIHDIVPEFYATKFGVAPDSFIFKLLVAVERASTNFANHVIASNHIWQKRLEGRSVDPSRVTTVLNYPDTDIFCRGQRTRKDDKLIILYPGSLNYHQGLDLAITAFSRIIVEFPNAELHIYGSGGQISSLKAQAAELGLEGKVVFKKGIPVHEIARVIENADLGVVPKRKDGFGNEAFSTKILEFMAMGIPVVVANTAIDRLYFDESVVEFFEANDAASLTEALRLLLGSARIRQALSQNATAFAQRFSWKANQHIYLDLVDSLLDNRQRPSLNRASEIEMSAKS